MAPCGMRGTTCIMTVLAVIICATTLYLATELVQTARVVVTGTNASLNISFPPDDNNTVIRRIRRATVATVIPTHGLEENIITITEGSSVRFDCNPWEKHCPRCRKPDYADYAQVYFCKDPCEWKDVKAYRNPTSYGMDGRFRVAKKNRYGHNSDGMTVTMMLVETSEASIIVVLTEQERIGMRHSALS